MTFAIEPMISIGIGSADVLRLDNYWNVVTRDGLLSAYYWNIVLIIKN